VAEHVLTTVDNPFNPVTQFNEWHAWDLAQGHDTLGLLGRVVVTSDDLSEADEAQAVEYAIDEIVRENVSGLHRKVSMETGLPS
jgi:hypothetical protein